MAEAFRCNSCTEFASGREAAELRVNPNGTPEEYQAHLCEGCLSDMMDALNLSDGTMDL